MYKDLSGYRGAVALHASVSDEARDGWRLFAQVHGVSVTGLLEALGLRLAFLDRPEKGLPVLWREVLAEARAIDAERRSRERGV